MWRLEGLFLNVLFNITFLLLQHACRMFTSGQFVFSYVPNIGTIVAI